MMAPAATELGVELRVLAEGPDVYKLADAGNQGDGRAEDALGQEIHSAIAFHGGGVDVRSGRDRLVHAQAPIHV